MSVANLKSASSSALIAYDEAQVVPGIINDTFFLSVSGTAPCLNMEVQLRPRIYIHCPDYWAIEVTGTLSGGFCLEATKPYVIAIPLAGVIGRKGIELVGGNKSQTFDLEGGCD